MARLKRGRRLLFAVIAFSKPEQRWRGDDAVAEAVDSSEAWKAARVLKRLALSWEGLEEAVPGGWAPTHRESGWKLAGPREHCPSHLCTLLGERRWWGVAGL